MKGAYMKFTDDDLGVLKMDIYSRYIEDEVVMKLEKAKSLIARLEAAEKVCEQLWQIK